MNIFAVDVVVVTVGGGGCFFFFIWFDCLQI
jgi:hypothetical protein